MDTKSAPLTRKSPPGFSESLKGTAKPIFVVGAEHSGTRWVSALLNFHPETDKVLHLSQPTSAYWINIPQMLKENPGAQVVLVCRDHKCNLKSIQKSRIPSIKTNKTLLTPTPPGTDFLNLGNDFEQTTTSQHGITERKYRSKRVVQNNADSVDRIYQEIRLQLKAMDQEPVMVSYESLVAFRDQVLTGLFNQLGLNPKRFDYEYTGELKMNWFTVKAIGIDGNRKY